MGISISLAMEEATVAALACTAVGFVAALVALAVGVTLVDTVLFTCGTVLRTGWIVLVLLSFWVVVERKGSSALFRAFWMVGNPAVAFARLGKVLEALAVVAVLREGRCKRLSKLGLRVLFGVKMPGER